MRLFVAVDASTLHDSLVRLQGPLTDAVRASFPRSFHLTLRFLDELPDAEAVASALQRVTFRRFTLELSGLGAFPDTTRPRLVWVGFKPSDQLTKLQQAVEEAVRPFVRPDERFHPHLTLARVKEVIDRKRLEQALSQKAEAVIDVSSFELVHSVLSGKGPLYETVTSIRADG